MSDHPITPPPELAAKWVAEIYGDPVIPLQPITLRLVERAAQWGADQELEACCEEMKSIPSPLGIPFGEMASNALRAARRPKPPSLKAQAILDAWENEWSKASLCHDQRSIAAVLRAAADQLDHPTSAHTLYAFADELEGKT
jgi:hypothetical protein